MPFVIALLLLDSLAYTAWALGRRNTSRGIAAFLLVMHLTAAYLAITASPGATS